MHRISRPRRWHRGLQARNLRHKGGANGRRKKAQQQNNTVLNQEKYGLWQTVGPRLTWMLLYACILSTLALSAIFVVATVAILWAVVNFLEVHWHSHEQGRRPLLHKLLSVFLLGISPLYVSAYQEPNINEDVFFQAGRGLINRRGFSRVYMRRFKSYFGATPSICAQLWQMLDPRRQISSYAKPVHLLWALMLIRVYATEEVLAGIAGVTEKTFRKWAWAFITATADVSYEVVSLLQII